MASMVGFRYNVWASKPSCLRLPTCDYSRIPLRNEEVRGSTPLGSTNHKRPRSRIFCRLGRRPLGLGAADLSGNSSSSPEKSRALGRERG